MFRCFSFASTNLGTLPSIDSFKGWSNDVTYWGVQESWIPSSLFRHKPMPWHDKHAFAYSRDHDDVSFRLQTHVKATGRKENSFHEDKDGEHDTKLRLCCREKNWSYEASTIARIFIEGRSLQDYEFINFGKWVKNGTICNFNLMLLQFKLPSNY